MSNKVKEYQIVVRLAEVAVLKTDYRSARKGYADLWFRNIAEALKGVEGVNVTLYSRGVPVEKIERQLNGGE